MEAVGAGVTDLKPGDRVAYGNAPLGAYAEARLIPAHRLIKIPRGIDDRTAAAMMLKGLTVQYLIRQTYRLKAGDTILLHAPKGGVGSDPFPSGRGAWAPSSLEPSEARPRPSWPGRMAVSM